MFIASFIALAHSFGVHIYFIRLCSNKGYLFAYLPSGKRFRTRLFPISSVLKGYFNYDL